MGKLISGISAFLRDEYREKLEIVMKRNLIRTPKDAIEYCIYQTWFEQVGQYEDKNTVEDVPQCWRTGFTQFTSPFENSQ